VAQERDVLDEIVQDVNRDTGQSLGLRLELFRWERDVVPQIGPEPQQVVDQQTPAYDVYLGILSTRFGTPTASYGSGTEEEFHHALQNWQKVGSPWIAFYFDDAPKSLRKPEEIQQWLKVSEFRQKLETQGIVCGYVGLRGSAAGFYEQVSNHLRKILHVLANMAAAPVAQARPTSRPCHTAGLAQGAERQKAQTILINGPANIVIQTPTAGAAPTEPPDPTRYLESLRQRNSNIEIRGLQVGSGRAPRFPIEELYIPLTTSAACRVAAEPGPPDAREKPDGPDTLESLGDRLAERVTGRIELRQAMQHDRLVIIGDPGSGKTTLLRRITLLTAEALLRGDLRKLREQLGLDRPWFPIFVRVADLIDYIATAKNRPGAPALETAPVWLTHFLASASEEANLGLDEAFFRDQLESGQALVLLDGLDEAPTEKHRRTMAELLERTTERYGRCRYVLTSRPAAFTDELVLPGFVHVEIDPLEDAAIETFLRRWCEALFADSPAEAGAHCAELLDALRARFEIRRLARNPVMLTALAVVHWNEKRLPEQRADLYESIITWLSRARMHRPHRSPPERCVGLLQDLALAMQDHAEGRQTQIPRHAAATALAPY